MSMVDRQLRWTLESARVPLTRIAIMFRSRFRLAKTQDLKIRGRSERRLYRNAKRISSAGQAGPPWQEDEALTVDCENSGGFRASLGIYLS